MADVSEKAKRVRKLGKGIEGTVVVIKEAVTNQEFRFDFATLPAGIQQKLGPYGLSQKLGDAAAGKEGQVAVDSINKVWEGLVNNDWTVRAPAAEKVSKNDILANFEKLSDKERKVAAPLLKQLGILPEKYASLVQ
jgi:hypothetical protein